jgi:hypothetical protein
MKTLFGLCFFILFSHQALAITLKTKILNSAFETDCFYNPQNISNPKCPQLQSLYKEFKTLKLQNPKLAEKTLKDVLNTEIKNKKYKYLPFLLVKLYPAGKFTKELKELKQIEKIRNFPFHYANITLQVLEKGHCPEISSPFFYELCRWKPQDL